MIAIDTSSCIAYLNGDAGPDVEHVEAALWQRSAVFPPAVYAELLSHPHLPKALRKVFADVPLLSLHDGYWERVGLLRAHLFARQRKARLAGALIAQSCLDHVVPLVTRDTDFRHFAKYAKLELV